MLFCFVLFFLDFGASDARSAAGNSKAKEKIPPNMLHASALLDRHIGNLAEDHLAVRIEVEQSQGAHPARRAARHHRGRHRHGRRTAGTAGCVRMLLLLLRRRRCAAAAGNGRQRRHQRIVAARILIDEALAVAVERLVHVRRDDPVPAERTEIDAQRIPAAVLLLAVRAAVVAADVALAAPRVGGHMGAQLDVRTLRERGARSGEE